MTEDDVRREVMSQAREDYSGLYEIIWALTAAFPGVSEADKVSCARDVIFRLLDAGEVVLYWSGWPGKAFQAVSTEDAEGILELPESWIPGERFPWVAATEAGVQASDALLC
jgi:hypothetical protein